MKFKFSILGIMCLFSFFAQASSSFIKDAFITIGGGLSNPTTNIGHHLDDNKDDSSYHYQKVKKSDVLAISLGKNFGSIKTELEYLDFVNKSYTQGPYGGMPDFVYKYNHSSKAYLLNLGYRFLNLNKYLDPYVNISIGLAEHRVSKSDLTYKWKNFGYYYAHTSKNFSKGFGLGTLVNLNEYFALDFSYKYLDLGKIKGSTVFNDDGTIISTPINIDGKMKTNLFMAKLMIKF